ncbi:MAG: ATPase, T2SS/T4P/T4SS family [Gluconacetobacter sp.]
MNDTNQSFAPGHRERITGGSIDQLITWCAQMDASRIFLQSGRPVTIRRHGRNVKASDRALHTSEIEEALNHFYRDDAVSMMRRGIPINTSHCVWPDRRKRRHSFRVHAHSCQVGATQGSAVILRPLQDIPRPVADQHVEPELLDALDQGMGFYLVCGATGSGKTTLLGGVIRHWLEDPQRHYNIIEGAAPTEILYDLVSQPTCTIDQTEIPRDFPTFAGFIEGCTRSEPTHIVLVECNSPATMEAAIQGGISGHALLTSLHTKSPQETIRRIIGLCPADQRDSLVIAALEGLKLIVNQRLLLSTDGKRTPVRSFIRFTNKRRARLLDAPVDRWPNLIGQLVEEEGQTFATAIARAHEEGRISDDVAGAALREEE